MAEMNPILPPNLDAALNEFYAGTRPDPAFAARLEAQLRQHQIEMVSSRQKSRFSFADSRRSFMQTLRARPLLAVIVAILALLALTGIAYALGRVTGFIPGFGFTSDSGEVSVLSESVETSRQDIIVRLDNAVSDESQFWAALTVIGLAGQEVNARAFVLLPGGEKLQFEAGSGSSSADDEKHISFTFPALPAGTSALSLVVENVGGMDFVLPLELRPVQAGEMIAAPSESASPMESESHNRVRLTLDHVAIDSSETVFQVSLRYDQPNTGLAGPWNVILSDAAGIPYPLTDITPDTMNSGDTHVYQTVPFTSKEQLVLTLVSFPSGDTLPLFVDLSEDSHGFTFDPGAYPEIGQRWELNQVLSAGGFDLKVVGATLTGEPGLVFEVEPGPSVTGVMFRSPDPRVTGSAGGVPVQSGNVTSGITFSEIPQQPFEVRLMRVYYQAKGPWTIRWQPPAAPTPPAGAPTPSAVPTLAPLPTPTLAASDPILLEVQQLAQRFDAPFQQGPVWVHVVKETLTNPQAGQNFPPPYLKAEEWFEVDGEGYVTRNVHTDYDEAGRIIQQAATLGDYSVNFTTGDAGFNRGARYRISLDLLTRDLSQAAQYGSSIMHEESICEGGRQCLLITLLSASARTVQNPGETRAFTGYAGRRVWIDLESGQQVKEQSFWRLEDGSEVISSTSSYILVEKAKSPPQEILDILARVHGP